MNMVLEMILIGVGFLSVIPVVFLFNTKKSMKYRCLKFLVNSTFVWTVLVFIERISENTNVIYYAHMLGYPLKFLMASFMLCTIFNYIDKKLHKGIVALLASVFLAEYILAVTNAQTQLLLALKPSEVISYESLYGAANGPIFMYHLILTYAVLLVAITYMLFFLSKRRNIRQYNSVTRTMVYSVIFVLLINLLQLTVIDSTVDLTYISLVIVTFILYQVIYQKDMVFNLKTSGRGEILSNMREMYILTDNDKRVVEISNLFEEKYLISLNDYEGKPLALLLEDLKDKIVVYEEYNVDETQDEANRDHYHLREKKFKLNRMNEHGYMILLYDETQVFILLRELNQLSNYDNMTGLHNRNYIESRIKNVSDTKNIGVLSLDLNGLKINNDYLGHERGDYLLKQLSYKMKQVMHDNDGYEMARIGGDEFLIVMKNTTLETLESIRTSLLELCYSDEIMEKISVSIGVAFEDSTQDNIYELIQKADADMYRMKKQTSKEYSKEIVLQATKNNTFIR